MDPTILAFGIVILLFSVILHEVMHGYMALKFGDHTAEYAGRLTLNPLPHIDPIGTIILPLFLLITGSPLVFGWAKPVPVNPLHFHDIKKGELFTSAAGVLANFGLAVTAAILFHLLSSFATFPVLAVLKFMVDINLILAFFNLLPIPPLDGSKVLMSFLPPKMAASYQQLERYGFLILIFLLLFPVGNTNIIWLILGSVLKVVHAILGV